MNQITIELCAEDRARLDKLNELLARRVGQVNMTLDAAFTTPQSTPETTQEAQEQPKEEKPVETPAKAEKAAESTQATPPWQEEKKPAPDRRTVKSIAVKKIQDGHRDEVKALIKKYGAEKIDLVPEDSLAAFVAELEKIGG